jgi:hypothetical protein
MHPNGCLACSDWGHQCCVLTRESQISVVCDNATSPPILTCPGTDIEMARAADVLWGEIAHIE